MLYFETQLHFIASKRPRATACDQLATRRMGIGVYLRRRAERPEDSPGLANLHQGLQAGLRVLDMELGDIQPFLESAVSSGVGSSSRR
jgi:hypothetical protein